MAANLNPKNGAGDHITANKKLNIDNGIENTNEVQQCKKSFSFHRGAGDRKVIDKNRIFSKQSGKFFPSFIIVEWEPKKCGKGPKYERKKRGNTNQFNVQKDNYVEIGNIKKGRKQEKESVLSSNKEVKHNIVTGSPEKSNEYKKQGNQKVGSFHRLPGPLAKIDEKGSSVKQNQKIIPSTINTRHSRHIAVTKKKFKDKRTENANSSSVGIADGIELFKPKKSHGFKVEIEDDIVTSKTGELYGQKDGNTFSLNRKTEGRGEIAKECIFIIRSNQRLPTFIKIQSAHKIVNKKIKFGNKRARNATHSNAKKDSGTKLRKSTEVQKDDKEHDHGPNKLTRDNIAVCKPEEANETNAQANERSIFLDRKTESLKEESKEDISVTCNKERLPIFIQIHCVPKTVDKEKIFEIENTGNVTQFNVKKGGSSELFNTKKVQEEKKERASDHGFNIKIDNNIDTCKCEEANESSHQSTGAPAEIVKERVSVKQSKETVAFLNNKRRELIVSDNKGNFGSKNNIFACRPKKASDSNDQVDKRSSSLLRKTGGGAEIKKEKIFVKQAKQSVSSFSKIQSVHKIVTKENKFVNKKTANANHANVKKRCALDVCKPKDRDHCPNKQSRGNKVVCKPKVANISKEQKSICFSPKTRGRIEKIKKKISVKQSKETISSLSTRGGLKRISLPNKRKFDIKKAENAIYPHKRKGTDVEFVIHFNERKRRILFCGLQAANKSNQQGESKSFSLQRGTRGHETAKEEISLKQRTKKRLLP